MNNLYDFVLIPLLFPIVYHACHEMLSLKRFVLVPATSVLALFAPIFPLAQTTNIIFLYKLRVGHIAIGLSKVFLMTHDLLGRSLCALRGTTLALNIVDQSS